MADGFQFSDSVQAPARRMWAITPHDANAVDPLPKALRFESAGTVVLRAVDSSGDVTVEVIAGEVLPVRAQYVRSTGTDANVIHGLA